MSKIEKRKEYLRDRIQEQLAWIADHGADEDGYVGRYGDENGDPTEDPVRGGRYGDGGQPIFLADMAKLAGYRAELEFIEAGGVMAMTYCRRCGWAWGAHDPIAAGLPVVHVTGVIVTDGVPVELEQCPWYGAAALHVSQEEADAAV